MHQSHRTTFKQKSVWSFHNFLPRDMYFTTKVAVTHRNTIISHLIYMKFAFAPLCVVSSGRLFFHKGNMTCESELQFNCNHNDVPTIVKIDIGLFKNCAIQVQNTAMDYFKLYSIPLLTEGVRNIVLVAKFDFNRLRFFLRCF